MLCLSPAVRAPPPPPPPSPPPPPAIAARAPPPPPPELPRLGDASVPSPRPGPARAGAEAAAGNRAVPAPVAAARLTPAAERRGRLAGDAAGVVGVRGRLLGCRGSAASRGLALTSTSPRLGLSPAALQLRRTPANLPLVAKPLFGVLSDAVYIGRAHRLPTSQLELIAWGTLAVIPATSDTFPTQMACILIGNLGASVTEVVSDAVVTEFSRTQKAGVLQSYAFIALAAGSLLGNLSVSEDRIFYPLTWIMTSFAVVPILSGTMFCFQTQYLKLDPSIIGLSKVMGQIMVLSLTVLYNRYLKRIHLRYLIAGIQMLYAVAVLSDFALVKQINLMLGIPNEIHVLCFSALAEAIAQFKVLPFSVLLSSLCPPGCEGSLFAFFTSGLVFSAILSGVFGVGLSTLIGVSSVDYSNLPLGILLQSFAALLPLGWISFVPEKWTADEKIVIQR
ncbi:hypothetical protein HU200_014162 [Digitaria exilis]|uniref:Uncharacterized protein n=1 Tax=Digitaria exilis TaxID=1010633 RepID=A0A835FBW4_9POAL|nr:hypothetical protein HU200_014162 [Digitaria exilis]